MRAFSRLALMGVMLGSLLLLSGESVKAEFAPERALCACCADGYDEIIQDVVHSFPKQGSTWMHCGEEDQSLEASHGEDHAASASTPDSNANVPIALLETPSDAEDQIGFDVPHTALELAAGIVPASLFQMHVCAHSGLTCSAPSSPTNDNTKHEDPLLGTCEVHNWCRQQGSEEENLMRGGIAALLNGDYRTVANVLKSSPRSMRVNSERSLVQLFNCSGEVVAQVQIDSDVLAHLMGMN